MSLIASLVLATGIHRAIGLDPSLVETGANTPLVIDLDDPSGGDQIPIESAVAPAMDPDERSATVDRSARPRLKIDLAGPRSNGPFRGPAAGSSGSGGSSPGSRARGGGSSGTDPGESPSSIPVDDPPPAAPPGGGSIDPVPLPPTAPPPVGETDDSEDALVRLGPGPWATTWSDVPGDTSRLSAMTWIRGNGVADTSWTSNTYFNARTIAQDLARQPAGRRTLFPWRYRNSLLDHPFDRIRRPDGTTETRPSPFVNAAKLSIKNELSPVLDELVALGAEVDYLIGDIESNGHFACWNIDQSHIQAILEDPRFETQVMGNGSTPRQMLGSWNAGQIKNRTPPEAAAAWNAVMDRLFSDAILESMIRPVVDRWPEAVVSNYGSMTVDPDETVPDMNGWHAWADSLTGTHPAIETYGRLGGVVDYFSIDESDPTRLARRPGEALEPNGWTSLRIDVNRTRAMLRSRNQPLHVWIATPAWETDGNWRTWYSRSPYFRENVFHQALGGAWHFIYWNPIANDAPEASDRERRHEEARQLQTILEEVDSATRGDPEPLPLRTGRIRWDSRSLLSGARLKDGSSIWRLTVSPEIGSVRLDDRPDLVSIPPLTPGVWLRRDDATPPQVLELIER